MLKDPPEGFEVRPVFASLAEPGYFYAGRATAELTGHKTDEIDTPVEYGAGDIFFGLDFNPRIAPAQESYLLGLKRRGCKVCFLVHDILPVTMPRMFETGTGAVFRQWLETISQFDGVICVSKTTAEELRKMVRGSMSPSSTETSASTGFTTQPISKVRHRSPTSP